MYKVPKPMNRPVVNNGRGTIKDLKKEKERKKKC